jgi:phosphoribosylanthranilate isomerase
MFVKICGITRRQDAEAAIAAGAQAIGFVFWPKSPRFVEPELARQIAAVVPPGVRAIGVFVDQPASDVNAIAKRVGLTDVQLHGDEDADYLGHMTHHVLKALPLGGAAPRLDSWPPGITILLDVHDPVRKGGTGRTADWAAAAELARQRDVILAGGLNPENVKEAIESVRPWGIDVSSGVESSPGIKDHPRLKALFEAVHGSHYATRS